MQATDLRIGNYVMLNNPKYRSSESVLFHKILSIQEDRVVLERLKDNEYKYTYGQLLKFIEPILLTEEILLKCRFEFNFDSKRYEDKTRLSVSKIDECYLIEIDNTTIKEIKYLHEIQNLYHSLTNQELQINL